MKVTLAKYAGFCFGVSRSLKLVENALKDGVRIRTLGPIIHNRSVVERLERMGACPGLNVGDVLPGETAVICSHGAPESVYLELRSRGIPFIDATCPDVRRIHDIVRECSKEGRIIIIIGEREHTEVKAIAGHTRECMVFENDSELEKWIRSEVFERDLPFAAVCQTTLNVDTWQKCDKILKKECTNCKIFDTICNATLNRQREAARIASASDAVVVVGDSQSSNTRRLFEICSAHCPIAFHIEKADELDKLNNIKSLAVTAGASTPPWIIKEVMSRMSEEKITMETESFAELLEASLKTLNTGDKVTGVVTGMSPTEIHVDLGTKHAGYIPVSEISDDPNVKPEDFFKIDQEVECYVMRVNDVEGTAMLSKKRLDSVKGWEEVEQACEDKTTVEGFVVEENKGGIVVSVKGVRVFVPASQTGIPKEGLLSQLMKKKVKLKITEVNRARRRVVGSIRIVANEERRAASEKVWADIQEGMKYRGVVKSLTSYGAFIDIGGVDGMIHVSELSWKRLHHPSEVLKIGEEIDVYVISLDREKKKISLGHRLAEENPWSKFMAGYNIGDVVSAKVVKLMPFGAFAEIIDGVDGLIHISQIADHRIAKPGDVLSEGQTVDVKITNVDNEKQKVWLSIRELLENNPSTFPEAGEDSGESLPSDGVVAVSEGSGVEIKTESLAKEVELPVSSPEAGVDEGTEAKE